jgi:hypothetical protein
MVVWLIRKMSLFPLLSYVVLASLAHISYGGACHFFIICSTLPSSCSLALSSSSGPFVVCKLWDVIDSSQPREFDDGVHDLADVSEGQVMLTLACLFPTFKNFEQAVKPPCATAGM